MLKKNKVITFYKVASWILHKRWKTIVSIQIFIFDRMFAEDEKMNGKILISANTGDDKEMVFIEITKMALYKSLLLLSLLYGSQHWLSKLVKT